MSFLRRQHAPATDPAHGDAPAVSSTRSPAEVVSSTRSPVKAVSSTRSPSDKPLTNAHDPATTSAEHPTSGDRPAAVEPEPAPVRERDNMLPRRERRRSRVERLFMRLVATGGVVGIGVAVGAILVSDAVRGWIVGLVVATLSVGLAAVLWSSRQL